MKALETPLKKLQSNASSSLSMDSAKLNYTQKDKRRKLLAA